MVAQQVGAGCGGGRPDMAQAGTDVAACLPQRWGQYKVGQRKIAIIISASRSAAAHVLRRLLQRYRQRDKVRLKFCISAKLRFLTECNAMTATPLWCLSSLLLALYDG